MKKLMLILFACVIFLALSTESTQASDCEYIDRTFCVPGWITNESWERPAPDHIIGKSVWYAPGLMRATAEWRGMDLTGFVGGVSMFAVEDIGEVVWILRPGYDWEGPFLVVDASQRNHMYVTVTEVKESVEVDFNTARRWGMVSGDYNGYSVNEWMIRDVEVYKGLKPPVDSTPVVYSDWFMDIVRFEDAQTPNPIWTGDYMKYLNYEDYLQFVQLSLVENKEVTLTYSHLTNIEESFESDFLETYAEYQELDVVIEEPVVIIIAETFVEAHRYNQDKINNSSISNEIEWEVNCDNNSPYDGFWMLGDCIPGVISYDTWMIRYPKYTIGVATYYDAGVMDTVLENRGMSLNGYKDAIVLMSCAHVGESVYIKRPEYGWEGPYLVVDCSQPYHMWLNLVNRNLHVEVSSERWQEWRDTSGTQGIKLCIGDYTCEGIAFDFWYYWEQLVEFIMPITNSN